MNGDNNSGGSDRRCGSDCDERVGTRDDREGAGGDGRGMRA